MTATKKKEGYKILSILGKINWCKLIVFLLFVATGSFVYIKYSAQINWFLVQRPEEKRIQMQYHLYGRHPIVDPAKGVVFINTGVYERTESRIQKFIETARNRKNSKSKTEAAMPNLLYFSGPSGIGKSTSLVRIANQYAKKRGWYVFYYDMSKLFQNFKLQDCLNVINSGTTNHKDSESMRSKAMYSDMPIQIQKKKFEKYVQSLLVLLENQKEVLIIFDGFHVFDQQPEIKILMQEFMKIVKKGGYLVAAGLNTEVVEYLGTQLRSARKNLWQIQYLKKLSQKQIRRYTKGNYPNLRKPTIQKLVSLADTFIEIRNIVKLTSSDIDRLKRTKATQIRKILSTEPSVLEDLCELCLDGKISEGKSTRILLKNNIAQDLESWETRITRMAFQDNFIDQCIKKQSKQAKLVNQCYDHRDFQIKSLTLEFQDIDTAGQDKFITQTPQDNQVEDAQEQQEEVIEEQDEQQDATHQQIKQQQQPNQQNYVKNIEKQANSNKKVHNKNANANSKPVNQLNSPKTTNKTTEAKSIIKDKKVNEESEKDKEVGPPPGKSKQVGPPPGKSKKVGSPPGKSKKVGSPPGKMTKVTVTKIKNGLRNQFRKQKQQQMELQARREAKEAKEAKRAQSIRLMKQQQMQHRLQMQKAMNQRQKDKIAPTQQVQPKVQTNQQEVKSAMQQSQLNSQPSAVKQQKRAQSQQNNQQSQQNNQESQQNSQEQEIKRAKQAELNKKVQQQQQQQRQRLQQSKNAERIRAQAQERQIKARQQREKSQREEIIKQQERRKQSELKQKAEQQQEQRNKQAERVWIETQQREIKARQQQDRFQKEERQRKAKQQREKFEQEEQERIAKSNQQNTVSNKQPVQEPVHSNQNPSESQQNDVKIQ